MHEAAVYGRVSYWTIRSEVLAGRIPNRRIGKKVILIPKEYFEKAKTQVSHEVTP